MSERRTVYKDASTGVGGLGPSQSQTYVDGSKLMGQQYGHAAKEIADLVTTAPIIPIGVVNPFAGGTAPTGWLLCDASEVSQTSYPLLYALLGTTWGTAASGNFKLPDLRGRVITGADGGAGRIASNNTLGDDGGAEDVSLALANIPEHTHDNTIDDGSPSIDDTSYFAHTVGGSGGSNFQLSYGWASAPWFNTAQIDVSHSVTISNVAAGGNGSGVDSVSNLQPYAIFNHIIKHD